MAKGQTLTLLTLALVAGPLFAQTPKLAPAALAQVRSQESLRVQAAVNHINGMRETLGLNALHTFKVLGAQTDELGLTHTHFQQHYLGVRVWGGDAIAHMDHAGNQKGITDSLVRNINLDVTPSLQAAEVLAIVHADLAPQGAYASAPTTELVVYPEKTLTPKSSLMRHENAEDFEYQVSTVVLAYHVHTSLRNPGETKDTDYLIDAQTGAILKKWNDLHTSSAVGTGNSQYSGTVSLNTNLNGSNYELNDVVGNMPIKTYNMNHATSGTGTLYSSTSDTWGNGTNYTGSSTSTTSATGQTAAVDAHYGIMATSAFYKNVFNRNGIDGNGTATYSKVHYSTSYDNAFWDDSCFCMTYGDGSSFKSLEALDVAGHEMSHGVCANNGHGGLTYSGEPGGLNEADSDIMGTFVTFYTYGAGGTGTTIPNTITNAHGYTPWTIGSQLSSTPLRYMYKPSLDGGSADYWTSSVGSLDVHYSSGPGNHMIYFLSQGATTSGNTSSTYLPSGMTGIGNDHAARIWYRALTTYFTSSMTYAQCRTACLSAASDLYGTSSAEYAAVQNAFHGINVGAAAPTQTALAISTQPASQSVTTGNSVTFTVAATGGTSPYTYQWYKNGTAVSGATSASYTFTTATTDSGATFYAIVKDSASTPASVTSSTATLTVTSGTTAPAITTQPASVSVSAGSTATFSVVATGTSLTYQWYKNSTAISGATSASYTTAATTTSDSGSTFYVKVSNSAGSVTSSTATLTVTGSTTGTEKILNGGFESGTTSWSGTTGDIGAWSGEAAYAGTKCAWLCGNGKTATEYLYQSVAIPRTATSATLSFYLHIDTAESGSTAYDKLTVSLQNSSGTTLKTLATYSNVNAASGYSLKTFDVSAYKGQTVRVYFKGREDSSLQTSFVLDNVSLITK